MIDARGYHLGDMLMLTPALRAGDMVYNCPPEYRPPLPIVLNYMPHNAPMSPVALRVRSKVEASQHLHKTHSWLRALNRTPRDHMLRKVVPDAPPANVVLAPAVRDDRRRWPHWDMLIVALHERGINPTLLSGQASREDWMRTLAAADAVVCPDTGTAHMADALGVRRVVSLHTSANSLRRNAPYWSRGAWSLVAPEGGTLADITPAIVMERLQ